MKKLEGGKKPQKKEARQINLLNQDKAEKTKKYNRKHGRGDKHKEKAIRKKNLRDNPSDF